MYSSGQQNQTDHTANFFWFIVLVFGAIVLVWLLAPSTIIHPIFWLRHLELKCVIFLSSLWNDIHAFFHLPPVDTSGAIALDHFVTHVNVKTLPFEQFANINEYIAQWVRWPVIGVMFVLAVIAYFRHSTMMFRQRYTMNELKAKEVSLWPQIQPVLTLDLVKEDPDQGPWAMATTPLDYCKKHQVIHTEIKKHKTVWVVDKGPAYRLFAMQLGPIWHDLHNLPIYVKALMVIFIARAQRERSVAKRFLSQIASSAASGQLDFSGVTEQLIQYQNSKILSWLRPRHAYVRTMMASLLEIARADGVLASAEFLWLKPVDRQLWYTLSCVGRQTAFIEVSGIFAHWKAEQAIGKAMTTPMVKTAVQALDLCIADILYVSGEQSWHSNEA